MLIAMVSHPKAELSLETEPSTAANQFHGMSQSKKTRERERDNICQVFCKLQSSTHNTTYS